MPCCCLAPRQSDGLVVPPWAASLPRCVFAVVRFFYLDLLLPEDDFEAAGRKMLVAALPFLYAGTGLLFAVLTLATEEVIGPACGGLVIAAAIALGALYTGLIVVAHCVPERAGRGGFVDLWAIGTLLYVSASMLGRPTIAWHAALVCVVYVAVLLRAPRRALVAALAAAVSVISMYNRCMFPTATSPTSPIVGLQDTVHGPSAGRVMDAVILLLNVPVVIAIEATMRAFQRHRAASRASAELAKQLAAALAQYDTAAASKALDDSCSAGSEAGSVEPDAELVEEWRSIVGSLEQFRPYLPNWLPLPRASVSSTSAIDDAVGAEVTNGARSAAVESVDDLVSVSGRSGVQSPRSHTHHNASPRSPAILRHGVGGPQAPSTSPLPLLPGMAMESRSVVVIGEFDVDCSGLPLLPAEKRTPALHRFVDAVHHHAHEAGAAIHSFVGDTIVASWNAASPCAHPEAKAARFACRLLRSKDAPTAPVNTNTAGANELLMNLPVPALNLNDGTHDSWSPKITGALTSGPGKTLLAGLGNQRALLACIADDVKHTLSVGRAVGAARGAVLVPSDLAVAAAGSVAFELAAVAIVAGAGPRPLHRVCGEAEARDRDEWIYVVAPHAVESKAGAIAEEERAVSLRTAAAACDEMDFTAALRAVRRAARFSPDDNRLGALAEDLERLISGCNETAPLQQQLP